MNPTITRASVLALLRSLRGTPEGPMTAREVACALTGREGTVEARHVERAERLLLTLLEAGSVTRECAGGEERYALARPARAPG